MTETEIKQMLAQGERLTLECKKAKTELPKSVWESYSAFANTIGGYISLIPQHYNLTLFISS